MPHLLARLNDTAIRRERDFERTAGDEVQGLLGESTAVVEVVALALRTRGWWIGVGVGAVEHPLGESVRATRGPALVAARAAVARAKRTATGVAVEAAPADRRAAAERAQAGLRLWAATTARRTDLGWEAIEVMRDGGTQREAARRLGVSPQTLNRRLATAGWADDEAARRLCAWLLERVEAA